MEQDIVIRAKNLRKFFTVRKSILQMIFSREVPKLRAVDGISFDIHEGEIFGLVGESGCGKTTTGKLLVNLIAPTDGEVYFKGQDLLRIHAKDRLSIRPKIQMIFQDPYASLNPRFSVERIVVEPLIVHKLIETKDKEEHAKNALEAAGLPSTESFLAKYPHELSGGQRQRVSIARALVLQPEFLVADEPVSMLDVSTRMGILNLLLDLRQRFGLSYLFIAHDLSVARYVCDNIMIMYAGKAVEKGPADSIINEPLHPYTKALISVVPVPDPRADRSSYLPMGDPPDLVNPPLGCRFHTRCQYARDVCRREEPEMIEIRKNHYAACHLLTK